MVSAQLYELDDLGACLLESLRSANPTVATKVAKEMIESGETAYLKNLLTLVWMLSPPDSTHDATIAAAATSSIDDYFFAIQAVSTMSQQLPEFHETVSIPTPKPSKAPAPSAWSPTPTTYTPEEANTFFLAIKFALKTKFWEHAAYLTQSLLSEDPKCVISLFQCLNVNTDLIQIFESTVYSPLLPRVIEHIYAAHVGSPGQYKYSKKIVNSVSSSYRSIQITDTIWNVKPKPVTRLQGAPLLIMDENASVFWKDAVKKYKITAAKDRLEFEDETLMEEFYTKYFPKDIPDEWSEKERLKSHGFALRQQTTLEKNPWLAAFHLL